MVSPFSPTRMPCGATFVGRCRRAVAPGSEAEGRSPRLLVVDPELLDLARDRVAPDAELERRFDAPAARRLERRADQLRLELAGERVPDHRLAGKQQFARAPLERAEPVVADVVATRRCTCAAGGEVERRLGRRLP